MKNILFTIIFLAVLAGAYFVAENTSAKVDMPFETGQLQAPDIQHHADGATGHGEAAHE